MPLYEYECQACGHHLEAQQKLADAPLKTCPECHKDELQKLISATAFSLKGGGWYKDLYASPKPGGESAKGESAKGESAKAEPAKSTSSEGGGEIKKKSGGSEGGSSGNSGGSTTPKSSGGGSSASAVA
jgi:putative FmdB family regulatory protein